jgi:HPt (histidine-containing phosphotransfer) domain-containing protein
LNYREKQRLYHDFAGTAGAIGAKDIQELALELALAWQNEQPDESVAAELEEKTRALLDRIHAVPISSTVV